MPIRTLPSPPLSRTGGCCAAAGTVVTSTHSSTARREIERHRLGFCIFTSTTPQNHRTAMVAIHCGNLPVAQHCGVSPAAKETGMRRAGIFAWWHRSQTIPLVFGLCAAFSGAAPATNTDGTAIEGRWETARRDLVLDISRCAQGYCGQLVTPDNKCERTILTVALKADEPPFPATLLRRRGDVPATRSGSTSRRRQGRNPAV